VECFDKGGDHELWRSCFRECVSACHDNAELHHESESRDLHYSPHIQDKINLSPFCFVILHDLHGKNLLLLTMCTIPALLPINTEKLETILRYDVLPIRGGVVRKRKTIMWRVPGFALKNV
jgi:hypothetical protein